MEIALLAVRILLGALFGLAAVTKLVDARGSREALRAFGVPGPLLGPAAVALPLVELAVAALLLPAGSAWWAGLAALAILLVFTSAVGWQLAHGRRPDCNCFGSLRSERIGAATLVRNGALIGLAGFVAVAGPGDPGPSATGWIADLSTGEGIAVALAAALAVIVAINAAFSFQLFKQNGRLWTEIEELRGVVEARRTRPGVGQPAPHFELPDLDGGVVSLEQLLDEGDGVVLVFSDPACTSCDPLLPQIGRLQGDPDGSRLVVISRGSVEDNRVKAAEHGLTAVLLQEDWEVVNALGINGVPGAIALGADGRVTVEPALGTDRVAEFLAGLGRAQGLVAISGSGS